MITSPAMPSADATPARSPEPPKPIRLLIVDDHPVLRAGLANLLQLESDFEVVGQAGSGEAAVRLWESVRPDVCLLDLSMPGMGGLESLRRILGIAANARVLVLTSSESAADANSALQAGASGYLTKNVEHAEIVSTIRQAHAGTRGICRGVSATITTSSPSCRTEGLPTVMSRYFHVNSAVEPDFHCSVSLAFMMIFSSVLMK
jgi:DNA-binding NarL/FixJ family response regulator